MATSPQVELSGNQSRTRLPNSKSDEHVHCDSIQNADISNPRKAARNIEIVS